MRQRSWTITGHLYTPIIIEHRLAYPPHKCSSSISSYSSFSSLQFIGTIRALFKMLSKRFPRHYYHYRIWISPAVILMYHLKSYSGEYLIFIEIRFDVYVKISINIIPRNLHMKRVLVRPAEAKKYRKPFYFLLELSQGLCAHFRITLLYKQHRRPNSIWIKMAGTCRPETPLRPSAKAQVKP